MTFILDKSDSKPYEELKLLDNFVLSWDLQICLQNKLHERGIFWEGEEFRFDQFHLCGIAWYMVFVDWSIFQFIICVMKFTEIF